MTAVLSESLQRKLVYMLVLGVDEPQQYKRMSVCYGRKSRRPQPCV